MKTITAFQGSVRLRQRGAVLIVSLMLLLVMTILALSMSQTSRLQERMAGNYRDAEQAQQVAEAGVRDSERIIKAMINHPLTCGDPKSCKVVETGTFETLNIDLTRQDEAWWKVNALEYGTSATNDLPNASADPKYVIEYYGKYSLQGPTVGNGTPQYLHYYKTTARGHGVSDETTAIVESVYAGVQ